MHRDHAQPFDQASSSRPAWIWPDQVFLSHLHYSHHHALPVTPAIGSHQSLQQWSRWREIASRANGPSFGLWKQLHPPMRTALHAHGIGYTPPRSDPRFARQQNTALFLLIATEVDVRKLFHLFVENAFGVLLIWADSLEGGRHGRACQQGCFLVPFGKHFPQPLLVLLYLYLSVGCLASAPLW